MQPPADSLAWLGYEPCDLVNFPGKLAATLFVQGCPLGCPYCHNRPLIGPLLYAKASNLPGFTPTGQILAQLAQRRSFIQGIVISGGEPLMHPQLAPLIQQIAQMGYPIKLDTAGIYPQHLQSLLQIPAITHLAIDLKTAPQHYRQVGMANGGPKLLQSLQIAQDWLRRCPSRQLLLRTTIHPQVTSPADLTQLDRLVQQIVQANPKQVHYTRQQAKSNSGAPLPAM